MLKNVKNAFKPFVPLVYVPYQTTSLGVRIRNPINRKGEWIGWTTEEVAAHLQAVRNYSNTLPPLPKSNGNGC
jgi:hypothetical protein